MNQLEIDNHIERFLSSYENLKLKLDVLQPRYTYLVCDITDARQSFTNVEELATKRIEITDKIHLIETFLKTLTKDEQDFVERRYFKGVTMRVCCYSTPGWSERQLYRLRRSILCKAAFIFGLVKQTA